MTDEEIIAGLAADLWSRRNGQHRIGSVNQPGYDLLDQYFSAQQPLSFLHAEVREQSGDRLKPLAVNWARVVIGAVEERLELQGFRIGDDDAETDLWRIWRANNMDEWSRLGHVDAMLHGRAFGLVWGNEEDPTTPRMTVESGSQMICRYKPGTTKITAAAKFYSEDPAALSTAPVTGWLYLPDRVQRFTSKGGLLRGGSWVADGEMLDNPLGVVPVAPLVNRPQLLDLGGQSELIDVLTILDAINKLATDMMVSSEYHSMPRRWATDMEIPRDPKTKRVLQERVREEWDTLTKGRTMVGGKGVRFGQFNEATLDNFINAIKLLVSQVAAIAGLPPHYLGINSDNPASADAIRSAESSLVKKSIRKQHTFGDGWKRLARLAICVRDGIAYADLPSAYQMMEDNWADPTTPTPGAKADYAVKLTTGDRPIIDVDQAREDLGYTPEQITRMNDRAQSAADAAATSDVRARIALAAELQAQQGLSQPAAFAAVGLLQAAAQMTGSTAAPIQSGQANT